MIDKVQIYTAAAAGAIVGVPLALALVQNPSVLNQTFNVVLITIIAIGTWISMVSSTIKSKDVLEARPRIRKPRERRPALVPLEEEQRPLVVQVEEVERRVLNREESEQLEKEWQRVLFHIRGEAIRHEAIVPLPPPRPVVPDAEALEDDAACVICMENKKTTCAVPCGHKILCNSCSREAVFETCPICRTPCDKIIRVYD